MRKLLSLEFIFFFIFIITIDNLCARSLSFGGSQSLNTPTNEDGSSSWFMMEYETNPTKETIDTYFDGSVRYYQSTKDIMYSIPEAYIAFSNISRSHTFTFGRKIINWNKYEKFWGLNHINGQRSYDLLDNSKEGIVGVHYDYNFNENFSISLVLSYLFIPQMNPTIEVDQGRPKTASEWYVLPPSKVEVKNIQLPMYYIIEKPSLNDVVINKTIGFNLTWSESKNFISAYSIYKPENKLRINAEAYLEENFNRVVVVAKPVVNYHGIYGLVGGFTAKNIENSLGVEVIDSNATLGKLLSLFI